MRHLTLVALLLSLLAPMAQAEDWPMWGHTPARNMASTASKLPSTFDPGKVNLETELVDLATTKNIKFVAKLGSQAYGNPTVAKGRIFVGTNNEYPRDPKVKGDRGIVLCLDEKTGDFLWQLVVPKLGAGKVSDWEFLGICSSPEVEGERVYLISSRCEVMCLDINGLKNGNDGPFKDEAKYKAGAGQPPAELAATDADIIWIFDMREEVGVFPHNITSSSVLIVGDRLYATTSNGQDWSHVNIPAPNAPTLVVLDKATGKLLGEEAIGISERLYHCTWASPTYGEVNGKGQVIFGAGDGFCYGFDPVPVKGEDDLMVLKELWRFDVNPPHHKAKDGKPFKYPAADGPSEIIATPVLYQGKVFVGVGQDPEHGDGVGNLACIDPSKTGDITSSGKVWTYEGITRTISTVAIHDDLVYAADYAGYLHCLDAKTGQLYWKHNTGSHIWASPLYADGKVYLGNEDGILTVFQAGKELKVLSTIEFPSPLYSSPIAANGVLYITTHSHLYAVATTEAKP